MTIPQFFTSFILAFLAASVSNATDMAKGTATHTTDWYALTSDTNAQPDGPIYASALWESGGPDPVIVIGGTFRTASGITVNGVAQWNGEAWTPLGYGFDGTVFALATNDTGQIVAGGNFTRSGNTTVKNIAWWDGIEWHAMGDGLDQVVRALTYDQSGSVIAGGDFQFSGTTAFSNVARWNGTSWLPLGTGMNDRVIALTLDQDGTVYAGGDFEEAGNTTVNHIARWDGSDWSPLGIGVDNRVSALEITADGTLIVGGSFSEASALPVNNVASWTEAGGWSNLGSGIDGNVFTLKSVAGGDILAGGEFVNGIDGIAHFDGSDWSAVGPGLPGTVRSLVGDAVVGHTTFGNFRASSSNPNYAARWDGSQWVGYGTSLGSGSNNGVRNIAIDTNGDLLAVGSFSSIGNSLAAGIARWDGSSWSAVPDPGFSVGLKGLAVDDLGRIITSHGTSINRKDGNTWSSVGTLDTSLVNDIEIINGTDFVVIGTFSSYHPNITMNVEGVGWRPLGSGLSNTGLTVTANPSGPPGAVVVGGAFTSPAGRIASWNGMGWSALGTGMDGPVAAIDIDDDGIITAGGTFLQAGGIPADRIAFWDGIQWNAFGDGVDGGVSAIERNLAGDLIVGGSFRNSGSIRTEAVAQWDGTEWSQVGSGLSNGDVSDLKTAADGTLFAAGSFRNSGVEGFVPVTGVAAFGEQQVTEVSFFEVEAGEPGEPTTIRVHFSAVDAPAAGHVSFVGFPFGSCTDTSLTGVNATTVEAQCHITYPQVNTYFVSAYYTGGVGIDGTVWAPLLSGGAPVHVRFNQTINFTPAADTTFEESLSVQLDASATSGLPVSFSSTTPGVCDTDTSTAFVLSAGICTIAADQSGNSNFNPAPQVERSFEIAQATQEIVANAPGDQTLFANESVLLQSKATSGLPVVYASIAPDVCGVSGSFATIESEGTCQIEVTQGGNENYLPAAPVVLSFEIRFEMLFSDGFEL